WPISRAVTDVLDGWLLPECEAKPDRRLRTRVWCLSLPDKATTEHPVLAWLSLARGQAGWCRVPGSVEPHDGAAMTLGFAWACAGLGRAAHDGPCFALRSLVQRWVWQMRRWGWRTRSRLWARNCCQR